MLTSLPLVCSNRRVTTVPTILEMQRMQERDEQELTSKERQSRQEVNKQKILNILNGKDRDQNYFSDPKLNEIIAEGLAREIEIHNLSDNSYSRKKISNYLRSMIIFKKR